MIEGRPSEEVDDTAARLLQAGGQVFAERGFAHATIREICHLAGANVAAVNYHFGDKAGLYRACLGRWMADAFAKYPPLLGLGPDAPPQARLHAFIRSALYRILDPGRPSWHGRLIANEMAEPSGALEQIVRERFVGTQQLLFDVLEDLAGRKVDRVVLRHVAASIFGQVLFYHFGRHVMAILHPEQGFSPAEIDAVAEHISRFSLIGLRGMLGAGKETP